MEEPRPGSLRRRRGDRSSRAHRRRGVRRARAARATAVSHRDATTSGLLAIDTKTGENLDIRDRRARRQRGLLPAVGRHGEDPARERQSARRRQGRREDGASSSTRSSPPTRIEDRRADPRSQRLLLPAAVLLLRRGHRRSSRRASSPTRSAPTRRPTGQTSHDFLDRALRRSSTPSDRRRRSPTHLREFPLRQRHGSSRSLEAAVPTFTRRRARPAPRVRNARLVARSTPTSSARCSRRSSTPASASELGQHYTSVPNILKTIEPLFLDELEEAVRRRLRHRQEARGAARRGSARSRSSTRPVAPATSSSSPTRSCASSSTRSSSASPSSTRKHQVLFAESKIKHRELLRHRDRRLRARDRDPLALDRQAPDERRVQGEVRRLDPADPAQGDRPDPAGNAARVDWDAVCPERRRRDLPHRQSAVPGRERSRRRAEGRLRFVFGTTSVSEEPGLHRAVVRQGCRLHRRARERELGVRHDELGLPRRARRADVAA